MAHRLADLAGLVGGRVVGDGELKIQRALTYAEARAGDITFIDESQTAFRLAGCAASAAVVPHGSTFRDLPVIQVDDVYQAFTTIVAHLRPPRKSKPVGIHPHARISPTAKLAANVEVHPGTDIGDDVEIAAGCVIHSGVRIMAGCQIGPDVTIFPNVVLYEDTVIGARCVIHAGCVLGSYGFGYKQVDGVHKLSPQLGYVELEDDVEVGAGSTIDRGTFGATTIGFGSKLDNQVQIAHNCRLGKHNLICAQVGIAGSTTTGDYVILAGQVGVRDHVRIGEKAILGAKAGVTNDIPAGEVWLGCPATPIREQRVIQGSLNKLHDMRRSLRSIQSRLDRIDPPVEPKQNNAA